MSRLAYVAGALVLVAVMLVGCGQPPAEVPEAPMPEALPLYAVDVSQITDYFPRLEKLLTSPDVYQQQLAESLINEHCRRGTTDFREEISALCLKHIQHERKDVRQACIRLAAKWGAPRKVLPQLIDRLDDPDADVRWRAVLELRQITGADFDFRPFEWEAERRQPAIERWRRYYQERWGENTAPESAEQ